MNRSLVILLFFVFTGKIALGQFNCSDSLIYIDLLNGPFIQVYNPLLPVSASNPSATTIPNLGGGLTLMPNINGGSVSPTLYSTQNGTYRYWGGTSWINTGDAAQGLNLAGCPGTLYSLKAGPVATIYKYDGILPAVPVLTLVGVGAMADLVTDCNCNFYVLKNPELMKFDQNGNLLSTYSLTGITFNSGPGFAIVGKSVFLFGGATLYVGTIIGSAINFTLVSNALTLFPGDIASCPLSDLENLPATITSGSLGCNPNTASLVVTTSVSPLNYLWSGPGIGSSVNSGSVISVNTAGTYTCVITQGNCQYDLATLVTTVVSNAAPLSPVISPTNNLCLLPNTQLYSSLSSTLYANQWNGPSVLSGGNSPTVSIGGAGIYSLLVTSQANGCTGSATANVLPVPNISLTLSSNTLCVFSQQAPNEIVLTSSGAIHYTLLASPGFSFNTVLSQPVSLYMTPPYAIGGIISTATLIGSNGVCTGSAIAGFSVLPVTPIKAIPSVTLICLGSNQTLTASGASSYTWLPTEGLTLYNDSSVIALISGPTIYSVTGIDKAGCRTSTEKVSLSFLPAHSGVLTNTIASYCVPFYGNFKFTPSSIPGNPIETQWAVNSGTYSSGLFKYLFKETGTYTLSVRLTDSVYKCSNTINFFVEAYPKPVADFSYVPEVPVELVEEIMFTAGTASGKNLKFDWFFIKNSGFHSSGEKTSYLFEEEGLYPVALVVKNTWGCSDTVIKVVEVKEDFNFFVPNAFTPNNDEKNDIFLPVTSGVKTYNLKIFDRWGELIFESSEVTTGWNGTYKTTACKDDAYVWKIELTTLKGEKKKLTGSVSIVH